MAMPVFGNDSNDMDINFNEKYFLQSSTRGLICIGRLKFFSHFLDLTYLRKSDSIFILVISQFPGTPYIQNVHFIGKLVINIAFAWFSF